MVSLRLRYYSPRKNTDIDHHPAIHMAFDCMAIGVGLFASVMATWEPNERFTYGCASTPFSCSLSTYSKVIVSYGRIETLSGFANGIFLILISIFIVFEAIQRLCVLQSNMGVAY
jgi:solute carrier family 30 (zinc transporter), member 5/7